MQKGLAGEGRLVKLSHARAREARPINPRKLSDCCEAEAGRVGALADECRARLLPTS
jgi:hypothetical protein